MVERERERQTEAYGFSPSSFAVANIWPSRLKDNAAMLVGNIVYIYIYIVLSSLASINWIFMGRVNENGVKPKPKVYPNHWCDCLHQLVCRNLIF